MKTFEGTFGLIGARGGSKRIPNKNIRILGGFPLVLHSIFTSRASYFIDRTFVSTNSPEIAELSFKWESEIILRPDNISQDTSTDIEWILHFLNEFKKNNDFYPEKLVFLRPTTPFRKIMTINNAIINFRKDNDSLRSVEEIGEAIEKHFKFNSNNNLKSICPCVNLEDTNNPNQSFSKSYKANGYVDILKSEFILDTKSLYGNKIQGFVTEKSVELDTPEDWEFATFLMEKKYGIC
jgi:N-acylneuraminate cytidylyltransferase